MKRVLGVLILFILCNAINAQHFIVKDKFQQDALKEIFKEANKGNPESMYLTAKCYLVGKMVEKDEKKGWAYLIKACEKGYARAWEERADLTESIDEAVVYYKKSVELFNPKDKYKVNIEEVLDVLYDASLYYKEKNEKYYQLLSDELLSFCVNHGHKKAKK